MVDSLDFKLHHGASYVTYRKNVTYFPQGGDSYSPSGVKVMKIMVTGDGFLDPQSVKLFFDVTNNHATNLTPIVSGAWGFIRRLRVICAGQLVDDIDNYERFIPWFK